MRFMGRTPIRHGYKKLLLPVPKDTLVFWDKAKKCYLCMIDNTKIYMPEKFVKYEWIKAISFKPWYLKSLRRK
jgi:hypothetical protein